MPLTTSCPDSEAGPDPSDASVDARAELCGRLGYSFGDPGLLDLALRHRSWCAEHGGVQSNERLEFLGLPKGSLGMLARLAMPRRITLELGDG